jgi:hypothetical protein
MRSVTWLSLFAALLVAAVPATHAQSLHATSTGLDWLAADHAERVAWGQRMARLFNKQDEFAGAVDSCLDEMLGDRDDVELSLLDETRQGDLPMLTASCVLAVQRQAAETQ